MEKKYRSVYKYVDPNKTVESRTINIDEPMETAQRSGLEGSIDRFGQIDPILCVMRGKQIHVFDGRHRRRKAIKNGEKRIFVKVWDEETPDEYLIDAAAQKRFSGRGQSSQEASLAFFRLNYPHVFEASDRKFSAEFDGKRYNNKQVYLAAVAKISLMTATRLLNLNKQLHKPEKTPIRWVSLNAEQERLAKELVHELKEWYREEQKIRSEIEKAQKELDKKLKKIRERAADVPGAYKRIRKMAGV